MERLLRAFVLAAMVAFGGCLGAPPEETETSNAALEGGECMAPWECVEDDEYVCVDDPSCGCGAEYSGDEEGNAYEVASCVSGVKKERRPQEPPPRWCAGPGSYCNGNDECCSGHCQFYGSGHVCTSN